MWHKKHNTIHFYSRLLIVAICLRQTLALSYGYVAQSWGKRRLSIDLYTYNLSTMKWTQVIAK